MREEEEQKVWAADCPFVILQSYGMEKAFGIYYKITRDLQILDYTMVGDYVDLNALKRELDTRNQQGYALGSHMLMGIPKEIYFLREKLRDGDKGEDAGAL